MSRPSSSPFQPPRHNPLILSPSKNIAFCIAISLQDLLPTRRLFALLLFRSFPWLRDVQHFRSPAPSWQGLPKASAGQLQPPHLRSIVAPRELHSRSSSRPCLFSFSALTIPTPSLSPASAGSVKPVDSEFWLSQPPPPKCRTCSFLTPRRLCARSRRFSLVFSHLKRSSA